MHAIVPDAVRRRIGRAGAAAVFVLGHPTYYPRFGFTRADELGIRCAFPGATDGAYMVRRLPGFRPVKTPVTLAEVKADPRFKDFPLVTQGRLGVMPVPPAIDKLLRKMAGL